MLQLTAQSVAVFDGVKAERLSRARREEALTAVRLCRRLVKDGIDAVILQAVEVGIDHFHLDFFGLSARLVDDGDLFRAALNGEVFRISHNVPLRVVDYVVVIIVHHIARGVFLLDVAVDKDMHAEALIGVQDIIVVYVAMHVDRGVFQGDGDLLAARIGDRLDAAAVLLLVIIDDVVIFAVFVVRVGLYAHGHLIGALKRLERLLRREVAAAGERRQGEGERENDDEQNRYFLFH